jgi:tRNA pseudouridine38-40 synthase
VKAKLVVAYDGTGFRGFARNEGVRTVAGTLGDALALVLRTPVAITGAGRTDAGVHAWGQVVSVDLPDTVDLDDLRRRLNKLCAPDVAIRRAAAVDDDFDARFSARWREYRYDVWNAPYPNPLLAARTWHVPPELDVAAMNDAAGHLLGEHDFASFCRRPKVDAGMPEPSLRRRVLAAAWSADGEEHVLRFEIRANAFCHQMVRSIVGTLVDVGTGKLGAGEIPGILAAGDRRAAGQVAPPQGLTLWEVGY